MDEEAALWNAVARANRAWLDGNPELVADLYAPDAVMVGPNLDTLAVGRSAVVRTYVDYVDSVQTTSFDVRMRSVTVADDVAVVVYGFDVTYVTDDAQHQEQGRETLVFRRHPGGWHAVWRGIG